MGTIFISRLRDNGIAIHCHYLFASTKEVFYARVKFQFNKILFLPWMLFKMFCQIPIALHKRWSRFFPCRLMAAISFCNSGLGVSAGRNNSSCRSKTFGKKIPLLIFFIVELWQMCRLVSKSL